jgi:hypothetical protein
MEDEEGSLRSPYLEPTRKQIDDCATAYVEAHLAALRTGKPQAVAYTKSEDAFCTCPAYPVKQFDFILRPITRKGAAETATAFGIDMRDPDAEERFRKLLFIDQTNRNGRETLASDFISGMIPPP